MLRTGGMRGALRTRLWPHQTAGCQSASPTRAGSTRAGLTRWPILMPVSAVALMSGAPSAAYAQCFGSLNAITSAIGTVNSVFLPSGPAFLSPAPNGAPDQQGGGVWTRAVAGTVDTQTNTNFSTSFSVPVAPGVSLPLPTPFDGPCRASFKQNYAGFEAGHDIAVLNAGNSGMDWHFGVLAGYVGVKMTTPQEMNIPGQSGNIDAPSAGLYASFSKGNLSADVQARLYEAQASSLGQRLDSRGYSFAGNVAYRFDLPGNWTLEPSVGGIFSHTSIDPLNIAGVPVPIPNFGLVPLSGSLQFNDVESLLGRASVKLGTSLPLGGSQVVAYPFVTASVFHEFEGNATASLVLPATPFVQGSGTLTASSIGTYGLFGGGSAFQFADTGWLGYARFDYRTGENVQGYSVSAGLRYQLEGPGAERRVPYPVKAPLKAAPAEGYDWTGLYVGLSAGSTWGSTHWDIGANPDFAGFLGGGQAGYNFQTGRYVWGIEGDLGASNARGAAGCTSQPLVISCEDNVGLLGSLTGRLGYTWARALFYAKAGWAFGDVTAGTSGNFVDPILGLPVPGVTKSTKWENGWTAGVGMEYALTDRWSAKAEYMHYEFPAYAFAIAQGATANASTSGDLVRVGVNYHFKP
jgi:opacity protein-like surface antigen